jgi:hypothetical protein
MITHLVDVSVRSFMLALLQQMGLLTTFTTTS